MSTVAQLKKIHVLERVLNLDDSEYRAVLSNFRAKDGQMAESSKELTLSEASALIMTLEKMVDMRPGLKTKEYASPKQRGFILGLWRDFTGTRAGDENGVRRTLDSFLRNRFHLSRFERIPRKKASKIISALRIMNKRKFAQRPRAQEGPVRKAMQNKAF
jgi:hypothetical protein